MGLITPCSGPIANDMDKYATGKVRFGVVRESPEGGQYNGAKRDDGAKGARYAGGVPPSRAASSGILRAADGKRGDTGMRAGTLRRSGDMWEATDPVQGETAAKLAQYEPMAKEAYVEALYALQQDDYPGKLVHAAHSLREVIDLLARSKQAKHEQKQSLRSKRRKALLQAVFDPLARQAARTDDECDKLASMYSRLSEIAHHGSTTAEELGNMLSRLEDILRVLDSPQLAVNKEMDDLLSKPPSDELAQRLTKMQGRWATQFRLAENLPCEWLPHMKKAGYFSKPRPADIVRTQHACKCCGAPLDGRPAGTAGKQPAGTTAAQASYFRWPPSTYLRRCAKRHGDEVTEIIMGAKFKGREERNPAVYIDFLACACDLPAPDAERVAGKALEEKWSDFAGITMLAEGYFELAKRLYLVGRHRTATEMLVSGARSRLLEAPGAPRENAARSMPWQPAALLDTVWFACVLDEKVIPLAQSCPWPVMDALGRLLREVVKIGGMRPWQAENDDTSWEALQDCIVERIVGCIRERIPRTPESMRQLRRVMKTLYEKGHVSFRRIELTAYAEFPDEFEREIETAVLMYFDRPSTRAEYRNLLKASFGSLSQQAGQEVLRKIDNGLGRERLSRLAEEHGVDMAADTEKRWKLRHLHLVKEHLEGEYLATYSRLREEMGEPEQQGRGIPVIKFHEMGQGGGALAGKSADEAFEYMRNYENGVNEVFEGSTTGIEFEGYAKSNPEGCSKRAHGAGDLSPASQCCLVAGLDGALRVGDNIDWDGALQLIEYAVAARRLHGRAPGRSALLNYMCGLIETGLRGDLIDIGLRGRVWGIIEAFVRIGTECTEGNGSGQREQMQGGAAAGRAKAGVWSPGPDGMNSLDASRIGIDGLSFHAVYWYAAWCQRHGGEKEDFAPEARRVFNTYLDKGMGAHSAERHAVLGAFLTALYHFDREWAERLPSRIASGRDAKAAFWESYVMWNDVYPHVFKDMLPLYREFSKKGAMRSGANRRASEYTIIHAMVAYFYGLEGADKPARNLLGGSDDTLQECARQVGGIIKDKADDPDFDKERLVSLWKDQGLARCDLGMWLVNSPLDKRDTIALYRDHVVGHPRGISRHAPVSHLAPYAQNFPEEVADCLDALVDRCDGYVPEHVRDVLAILRGSDNASVNEKCRAIDEKLAQRGCEWGS